MMLDPALPRLKSTNSNTWQADRISKMANMLRHCSIYAKRTTLFGAGLIGPNQSSSALFSFRLHGRYAEHGAPLRVYSAVKLGYKMVK